MELKRYIHIIIKRLWLILLLPLAAGTAAAYVSFYVMEPVYQANSTLYIMTRSEDMQYGVDYLSLMAGVYLVKDYRELAKSRTVTEKVITELGLKNITPERLASHISINSKNETRIIEITVRHGDPRTAMQITDKVSEVFVQKAAELMKIDTISIVDKAQIPSNPVEPVPVMNMAVAVLVGLIAAAGIIILLEYLDDTIKTADDVEKYLGLTVLGTIPVFSIK
jgi:capsular polysaccharide biosynthesis protein